MRMGTSRFASLTLLCAALLMSAPVAAQGKKAKGKAAKPAELTAADSAEEKNSSEPEDGPVAAAPSGGMCIAAETPRAITECPANMGKAKGKIAGAPESKLRQSKRKVEQPKGAKKMGPSIELDVQTLRNKEKIEERAETLLRREIDVTRRLIKNTRTNDPRRPDFLLRLAEGFFELVQVATRNVRKLDDPIHQACQVKKNKGNCDKLRKQQKDAEAAMGGVREENIRTLAQLVKDHPDYKKMDEVLFSLGFSLEEMKQFDRARQVYHRLIKTYPQSAFVPNAYLSFAEYYFQQGDMAAAKQFYAKVTEIPPERNKVYGFALYKQAWCDYNIEDYKSALQKFVETIEFAQQNPEAHNVENLAKQSRRELVMPYAQVGSPAKALEFFSRYAKDDEQAYTMFESLGELYFDTGKWPEVIAVYHKLISEKSSSEKVCYWQTRVTNAVISSKPKAGQVTEIERMIDLYDTYAESKQSDTAKQSCKQAAASVLIDLATAWHREAIGTDTQPGTNDRQTMELASKLYRMILEHFPDMEAMQFPDIDKRDWPTEYKVSYYYAELLWKMENWAQCGPAFDKVLSVDPQGEFTEDAAYASVLCYNKQYQATFAESEKVVKHRDKDGDKPKKKGKKGEEEPTTAELREKYKPRDFTELEKGMLNAYQRYICFVPDSEDLPTIKYRRARIYYETNHFEEASVLFKDIAFNHPKSEEGLGVFAANLWLDSLNVLGTYSDPPRASCFDDMNEGLEPLFGLYCTTEESKANNGELCEVLEQLRCDLMRKKAEALQGSKQFKGAAQLYVRIFRKFPECGRLDEVLYNAAINFEAARLLGRAIKVRRVLIDKYPDGEWAKRALYLIGANYHALAMYDSAATYYEAFGTKYPGELGEGCSEQDIASGTCTNAKEAVQSAVFFRLGLGDEEKGVEDAKLFEKNYARKFPRETSQVRYSLGSIYERQEDWQKVIAHYSSFVKQYRKTALPHEIIQANVNVGRAYLSIEGNEKQIDDNKKKAEPYFRAAVAEYGAASGAEVPEDQKERFGALAKIGTAEAQFHLANREFDKFRAIGFPVFKAKSKNKADLQKAFQDWMGGDFVKWMGDKAKALENAQKSYESITELKVPQWEIAAATRVGDMYLSFVNDFRDAPVPPALQGDDELVDIYYQGLDEASRPWVEKAKNAYEFCLITATKVRWFNEYMTRCEEELFKLDPRTYPRAAELRGSEIYTHSAKAAPGLIELGGEQTEDDEGEE
jgi:tetratricopeptide (TPR) repeat protein